MTKPLRKIAKYQNSESEEGQQHLHGINPIFAFADNRTALVNGTRRELLNLVLSRAPSFAEELDHAIQRRQGSADAPLLGEMVPWLLTDLFDLSQDHAKDISMGWLALYMSAAVLDDILDGELQPRSKTILLSALLQSIATEILSTFLHSRQAHVDFHKNIQSAIEFEYTDSQFRDKHDVAEWKKATRLKNSGLRALAIVVAEAKAGGLVESARIRDFIDILILPFQLLDDIYDLPQDMRRSNRTYLQKVFSTGKQESDPNSLYFNALKSGTLERVVASIAFSLSRSIRLLRGSTPQEKDGLTFLTGLRAELAALRNWIRLEANANNDPEEFGSNLHKRLTVVAQYS